MRTCKTCHTPKPIGRFRIVCGYARRICMDCENGQRKRYYRANREACIQRSVKANKGWRCRTLGNRLKTRRWNATAVRNRVLGRTTTNRKPLQ